MPRKHNNKGRSDNERFLKLPHYMLRSVAWRSLSANARTLYVEIASRYNGQNNGQISYSVREACVAILISTATASRSFNELIDRGFLIVAQNSSFNLKTRLAREWTLTVEPLNGNPATKDFMKWTMKKPTVKKTTVSPGTPYLVATQ